MNTVDLASGQLLPETFLYSWDFFLICCLQPSFLRKQLSLQRKKDLFRTGSMKKAGPTFFASVLLLIIDLPLTLFALNYFYEGAIAGSLLGILITFKNIKAVRLLRFMRLFKISGAIHINESPMASRHVSTISSIVAGTIICALGFFHFSARR